MTERTLEEIKQWAIEAAKELKKTTETLDSNEYPITASLTMGHYEMAMDLCTFLGVEDQVLED